MNYWEIRAVENRQLTNAIEKDGFKRLRGLLSLTLKKVDKELKNFDIEHINEDLSPLEVKKLKSLIKNAATFEERDLIMQELYDESAKLYRYNRLDGLKVTLQAQLSELTAMQEKQAQETLINTGKSSYKFAAETYAKRYAVDLSGISKSTAKALADTTWIGGKNWSERIWKDRAMLGQTLNSTLKEGVARGYPLQRIAKDLKNKFHTSTYNAMRLVRTETTHVHEMATFKVYEDTGTKKYVFVSMIDDRTSHICRNLDDKEFYVKDAKVGVNMPPMHPNCRSTTAPVPDLESLKKKYGLNNKKPTKKRTRKTTYSPVTWIDYSEKAIMVAMDIEYANNQSYTKTFFAPKKLLEDGMLPDWFLNKKFEELTEKSKGGVINYTTMAAEDFTKDEEHLANRTKGDYLAKLNEAKKKIKH